MQQPGAACVGQGPGSQAAEACVACVLRSGDAGRYADVIARSTEASTYADLVKFLLMVRKKVKDPQARPPAPQAPMQHWVRTAANCMLTCPYPVCGTTVWQRVQAVDARGSHTGIDSAEQQCHRGCPLADMLVCTAVPWSACGVLRRSCRAACSQRLQTRSQHRRQEPAPAAAGGHGAGVRVCEDGRPGRAGGVHLRRAAGQPAGAPPPPHLPAQVSRAPWQLSGSRLATSI